MATFDGQIRIDTSIDGKGFNAGVQQMVGSLKGLAAAVGIAFGIGAMVTFGKTAVDTAAGVSSAMIGLQSVIQGQGRDFAGAKAFIQDYISDGLVPLNNAVTAYKNLAMRGYDDTQIQKTLVALKDAAAFGRQASLTMGYAVQTATEGLKNENSILVDNSGVTKNVSIMWKDYAESIGTTVAALTKQQKIQAEVNGILTESQYQTGDAARLAGTYSGQVSALGVSFMNLKVSVGNAIIPILQQIIPYIKAVVDWLTILFNTAARVIGIFFGIKSSSADTAASAAATAGSTQAAADAAGDLANNTKAAGKAAKGALAAFDQINVLQQETGSGGGAGAGGAGGPAGGLIPPTNPEDIVPDALTAKVEAFKQQLINFFAPLQAPFAQLKQAISDLGGTIWDGLKWAYDNILVPVGTWLMQQIAPIAISILTIALGMLNDVLVALQPLGQWLYDKFLVPVGNWAGQAVVDTLTWLRDRLKDIGDWIKDHQKAVEDIAIAIGSFAAAWALVNIVTGTWNIIGVIAAGVTKAFGLSVAFLTSPITLVIIAIGLLIAAIILLWKNWDWVKAKASEVWTWIVGVWNGAGAWFTNSVAEPIKSAFRTALDWVNNKFETVFGSVKDFVKNSINSIIDFINSMLQAVASGINGVIGALNSLSVTIPSWVPGFGGKSWGMSIGTVSVPQIPRLATGAVIPPNSQFLAVLGDQRQGTNIEAPADLIRQIVREEMGNIEGTFTFEFGGTMGQLVRELKPYLDKENVRIGGSLITVKGGAA